MILCEGELLDMNADVIHVDCMRVVRGFLIATERDVFHIFEITHKLPVWESVRQKNCTFCR